MEVKSGCKLHHSRKHDKYSKSLTSLATKWRNQRIWGQTNQKHEGRGDTATTLKQKHRWEGNNNSRCDPFLTLLWFCCLKTVRDQRFRHNTLTGLNSGRKQLLSCPKWTGAAASHEQAQLGHQRHESCCQITPPGLRSPTSLCHCARMHRWLQPPAHYAHRWLGLRNLIGRFSSAAAAWTRRVCAGETTGQRCRLQNPPPPIICALCVRACVRDRLPPN